MRTLRTAVFCLLSLGSLSTEAVAQEMASKDAFIQVMRVVGQQAFANPNLLPIQDPNLNATAADVGRKHTVDMLTDDVIMGRLYDDMQASGLMNRASFENPQALASFMASWSSNLSEKGAARLSHEDKRAYLMAMYQLINRLTPQECKVLTSISSEQQLTAWYQYAIYKLTDEELSTILSVFRQAMRDEILKSRRPQSANLRDFSKSLLTVAPLIDVAIQGSPEFDEHNECHLIRLGMWGALSAKGSAGRNLVNMFVLGPGKVIASTKERRSQIQH